MITNRKYFSGGDDMNNVNFAISVPEKKLNYPVHKDDMMRMLNLVNPKPDKNIQTHIGQWK